jgi:hypothetical protein
MPATLRQASLRRTGSGARVFFHANHRPAISNERSVAFDECGVTFRCKDYRAKGHIRYKTMTRQAGEFMLRCCARLLQVSTRSQKSDMSWQERERSVVSASLISIDNDIPSMARRCIRKYGPGRGHGCSLTDQVLNKLQQRQAALASSSARHQILIVFLVSKDMRGDGASHALLMRFSCASHALLMRIDRAPPPDAALCVPRART